MFTNTVQRELGRPEPVGDDLFFQFWRIRCGALLQFRDDAAWVAQRFADVCFSEINDAVKPRRSLLAEIVVEDPAMRFVDRARDLVDVSVKEIHATRVSVDPRAA